MNFLERVIGHKSIESQYLIELTCLFLYIYDLYKQTYYLDIIKFFLKDRSHMDITQISYALNLSESGYYRKLDDIKKLLVIIAECFSWNELKALILM